jgi:6-pyruvoyltetrahydropterin/6-carboxytetrahydropterin synthase
MAYFEITVGAQAECALRIEGATPPDSDIHGRTYRLVAAFKGEKLNARGYLADERELRAMLCEVAAGLDHKYLNELPQFQGVNPSAENMARWVAQELLKKLPPSGSVKLAWVEAGIHRDAAVRYYL